MKTVRAVIIGYGGMGKKYAQMLDAGEVSGMTLTGICCRNGKGQEEIRNQYPEARIYEDADGVFAAKDEFDAVVIVTPHDTHVPFGLMAARAGKHILMDKPLGISAKEGAVLVTESEKSGISLAMIFNTRMKGGFLSAGTFIKSGGLGRVTRAVWVCNTWYRTPAYHDSAPWRSTWSGEHGGLLINQCQHYLDIWQWLFGMPDEVYASIDYGKYNPITVDDSFDLQFFYKNGFRGTLISSTGDNPGTNRLEIWGTKGRLTITDGEELIFDENVVSTDEFARTNQDPFGKLNYVRKSLPAENYKGEEYRMIFQNFSNHLLKGETLMTPGEDGIRTLMMANGAYLSSWLEKKISYPYDEDLYEKLLAQHAEDEKALTF
ncbi:MAG: Gfo/Idh/MocA family oxidoreductase [Paenibacillaceae bacterium]|nr:Gfo/Idh/MocA family oxidoreductase [Paenibacillaceae bacterium]